MYSIDMSYPYLPIPTLPFGGILMMFHSTGLMAKTSRMSPSTNFRAKTSKMSSPTDLVRLLGCPNITELMARKSKMSHSNNDMASPLGL